MMVSWYSFFSAMGFYSVALAVVLVLRRRTGFLQKHGISVLLFISALAFVRLALPLDLAFSYVIESWRILPSLQDVIHAFPIIYYFLLAVWGAGAAVMLGKDCYAVLCAHKVCKEYAIIDDQRVVRVAKRLSIRCPVLVSPDVPVPYVAGLFRHTIYLPAFVKSEKEIELILLHEVQHIRSHDSQIKLLVGLLSAVFWWNPVIRKFRGEIDAMLELRCDTKVTAQMDIVDRGEYISMLLDMAKQAPESQPALACSAAVRPSSALQQRVMVLLDHLGAKPRQIHIGVMCCLIAAFLASYLVIIQPASMPQMEENGYSVLSDFPSNDWKAVLDKPEINSDTSFILKIDGNYYLLVNGTITQKLSDKTLNDLPYRDLEIVEGHKTR